MIFLGATNLTNQQELRNATRVNTLSSSLYLYIFISLLKPHRACRLQRVYARFTSADARLFTQQSPVRTNNAYLLSIPEFSCLDVLKAQAIRGVLCAIPIRPRVSSRIIPPCPLRRVFK